MRGVVRVYEKSNGCGMASLCDRRPQMGSGEPVELAAALEVVLLADELQDVDAVAKGVVEIESAVAGISDGN